MTGIHPSSIVGPGCAPPDDAEVGPFCLVAVDPPHLAPSTFGSGLRLRSHSVVYRGGTFGDRFQTGHGVLVREEVTVGDDVSVGSHSVVEHHVTLADGVRMHSCCFVPEHSILGPGAWLGPNVVVTNARYPNRHDTKANLEGVVLGAGATVGAGAVLLPGVRIGEGALVGAGSVVVRDVAAGVTVVGNPARELGRANRHDSDAVRAAAP